MELTIQKANDLVKALPIRHYLHRTIDIAVKENVETSFIDLGTNAITISLEQLNKALDKVDNNEECDEVVRGLVFHEVSHCRLTPIKLENSDVVNIFEDERIETLNAHTFKNVDFKKNLYRICGNKITNNNVMAFFYSIVRYRVGPIVFVNKVSEIINNFRLLNRWSDWSSTYDYRRTVSYFYQDVRDYYEEHLADVLNEYGCLEDCTFIYNRLRDVIEIKYPEDLAIKILSSAKKSSEKNNEVEEADISKKGKGTSSELSEDEFNDLVDKTFTTYSNKKIDSELNQIFANFKSISSNNAACINSYSGVLNPRLVGNDNYKWWQQQNRAGNYKRFSKFNLILCIDTSGSFCYNEDEVNSLLVSLRKLEKNCPLFSYQLITMNIGEKLVDDEHKMIDCNGGNRLDKNIFNLLKSAAKKDAVNKTIVLFDGDAVSNCGRGEIREYSSNFRAFDNKDTCIISDKDNEKYIERYAKNARSIITENYKEELIKNVINCLRSQLK